MGAIKEREMGGSANGKQLLDSKLVLRCFMQGTQVLRPRKGTIASIELVIYGATSLQASTDVCSVLP